MKTLRRTSGAALSTWAVCCAGLAQTTQPLQGLTEEQTSQVLRCRAIIANPSDSENTRRGQAEELLATGWPAAVDVLAELLGTVGDDASAVIVARAVANVGRDHPERLDVRLVAPLLRLLGESSPASCEAASAALAGFRNDEVFLRLGAVAADAARPARVRLAAVDALAVNLDLRPAVAELIPLLDAAEPEIQERAFSALAPASRTNYGRNVAEWKAWWVRKQAMDEGEWLRDRVDLLSRRSRDLQGQVDQLRRDHDQRYGALTKRVGDVLRLNLRLTAQPAQRDELLVGWLRDPLADLRLAAISLISEQIYDQQRPSDAVRSGLRERYADASVEVRRAALELVGALGDPADLEPILTRLAVEHDVDVRETILGVLGKLRNPDAISVLVDEISDDTALSNCVTRAALSLGMLARDSADPAAMARAAGPLRERLARQENGDPRARGALLAAMASIGLPEFTPALMTHLNEEDPEVLLPSIRGLAAVGDRAALPRLRALLTHADPRVRSQAGEALGTLGGDPADLEALLNRLTEAAEPSEAARKSAWTALNRLLKKASPDIRYAWAARFADSPDREIDYLTGLVQDLAAAPGSPPELVKSKDRLARLLSGQKRHGEALRYLEELFGPGLEPTTAEYGLLLLDAALRCGKHERLDELLPRLAGLGDVTRAGAVQIITAYLSEALESRDADGLPDLVSRLERTSEGLYGTEFRTYLTSVRERLATPRAGSNNPKI